MIKPLNKLEIEGILLNLIKGNNEKPTANIILNNERVKAFSLRSETRQHIHFQYFYPTLYWRA